VQEISHVINFDMPNTVDAYTHRIGRTGRACQTGEAFTFAGQADETMVREIEHVLGARIERRRLPDFDYSSFAPESPSRQARPSRPREMQSPKTYNRTRKGYDRVIKAQEPSGQQQARRRTGSESNVSYTPPRRPQQRKQFAAASAKRTW
jgi:ATP-dependent RNA helicase RhlE